MRTPGGIQETRVFSQGGVMIITMLSKQPKARQFRSWAVRILKSYRKGLINRLMSSAERKPDWDGLCIHAERNDELARATLMDDGFTEDGEIPPEYKVKPNLKVRAKLNALVINQNKWALNVYRHLGIPLPKQYRLSF